MSPHRAVIKSDPLRLAGILNSFPDFPQEGVYFIDILPLFRVPTLIHSLMDFWVDKLRDLDPSLFVNYEAAAGQEDTNLRPAFAKDVVVVGLEARGFISGAWLASCYQVPFIAARKMGKLPGECICLNYDKEYGPDALELSADSFAGLTSPRVIVVDDLLATGGSAFAAVQLVRLAGGQVSHYLSIVELCNLQARSKLESHDVHVICAVQYD